MDEVISLGMFVALNWSKGPQDKYCLLHVQHCQDNEAHDGV